MQKLQGKEEELSDGAIFFLSLHFWARFGTDGIDSKERGLRVVDIVCGINVLPLVVLSIGDGFAEAKERDIGIDQDAIVRQIAVLCVVHTVS